MAAMQHPTATCRWTMAAARPPGGSIAISMFWTALSLRSSWHHRRRSSSSRPFAWMVVASVQDIGDIFR